MCAFACPSCHTPDRVQESWGREGEEGLMITLVTGADGFIGQALVDLLVGQGVSVRAAVWEPTARVATAGGSIVPACPVGSIGGSTDWSTALAGIDTVVHLAARVHVMREQAADPAEAFREVNVRGTERLAVMAARAGVRRLVFVSSIKVNGEATAGQPFCEEDAANPSDAYGTSKWEAEQSLRRISQTAGIEVVIVRPPLVYGPGVKGNILSLMRWVDRGIPLPLARIRNQRSLVGLQNLVSLLLRCLTHPRAAGELFLVADGEDLSTPELLRRVAHAMGRRPALFSVPAGALRWASRLAGATDAYERLCSSLVVDSAKARRVLEWEPVSSVDEELRRTADWYRRSRRSGGGEGHPPAVS